MKKSDKLVRKRHRLVKNNYITEEKLLKVVKSYYKKQVLSTNFKKKKWQKMTN